MAITQRARELKAQGVAVVSLSAGEPDFDTPDHIKEAAIEAIRRGETKYTPVDGVPELKAAIQAKFRRDNGVEYEPAEIIACPGGKAVLYNVLTATVNPGDEVLIPTPYWVSYPAMVQLADGVPVIVETRADDGFKALAEQLEAASTARTRWLILNSPSNPSGAGYTRDELLALAAWLRTRPDILVLSDDIYEHLVYDGFAFETMAAVAPDLKDRIVTMNGASKAYAMTGWRIGYCGAPETIARAAAKLMGQTTSNPCSIAQWATVAALNGAHDFLDDWRAAYKRRRDLVVQEIRKADGLAAETPVGAFYVFASCEALTGKRSKGGALIDSDVAYCAALLDEAHVAAVPGEAFGAPGHFRISYATSDAALQTACQRIQEFSAAAS